MAGKSTKKARVAVLHPARGGWASPADADALLRGQGDLALIAQPAR